MFLMKISQIIINNYRAFYNEKGKERSKYVLNLKDGKNLLVYGENGSGKSSFYKALSDLFRSSATPDYHLIQNVFSKELDLDEQAFVEVTFKNGGQPDDIFCFSADPNELAVDNEMLRSVA